MKLDTDQLFKGFRFPPSIIQYAVWLYFSFLLSYPDTEINLVLIKPCVPQPILLNGNKPTCSTKRDTSGLLNWC